VVGPDGVVVGGGGVKVPDFPPPTNSASLSWARFGVVSGVILAQAYLSARFTFERVLEEIATPTEAKQWFGSEEAADMKNGVQGKWRLVKWSEDFVTIGDLLGLCKFAYYRSATFELLRQKGVVIATRLYNAITGLNLSGDEMMQAGERVFNVEKAFNTREGASRKDDTVPQRFFEEPLLGGGPSGEAVVDRERFDRILDEYYDSRGWHVDDGLPRLEKLEHLSLHDVANDLSRYVPVKD